MRKLIMSIALLVAFSSTGFAHDELSAKECQVINNAVDYYRNDDGGIYTYRLTEIAREYNVSLLSLLVCAELKPIHRATKKEGDNNDK